MGYEQPTAYIVESTDYNDNYETPVLTAGKSFILGYTDETAGICSDLPVIIFDDFTTDSRYVDFKFKVKSSAMKILHSFGANIKYIFYFMQTIECNHTTHKRYWISDYSQKIIVLPPLAEQTRIVVAIESAFAVIDEIERNKTELQTIVAFAKSKILSLAIRGKLVPQDPNDEPASVLLDHIWAERKTCVKSGKINRGKGESAAITSTDNFYYEKIPQGWALARLGDVLCYEQPTAYIVESTEYDDDYKIPVLTAGKSFIIGYTNETSGTCSKLPVIIFDDFTTDSRYVDFRFKVKSSAMKILHSVGVNIKYIFYCMQMIECNHTTHKRYWISDYSQKIIKLPPLAEQQRIVIAIETAFEQLDSILENIN